MSNDIVENASIMADEFINGDIRKVITYLQAITKREVLVFIDQLSIRIGYSAAINKTYDLL